MFSGLTPVLQWTMAGIFAILLVATLIVFVLRRISQSGTMRSSVCEYAPGG